MLAVQETNFLYSFTLSALSAAVSVLTVLVESTFNQLTNSLLLAAVVYSLTGFTISVVLYGRKTFHSTD
jgi:SNF family Na+-dependent transporter